MLVTFKTKAWNDITMFGDVAVELLKMMGHSGTVPSAMQSEDILTALDRLRSALAEQAATDEGEDDGNDGEPEVTLPQRALPLIELFEAAAAEETFVMWEN